MAVYVPSCTNRIFAGSPVEAIVAVSARAGLPVWIPEEVGGSCCGLPWSSKGHAEGHREKANEMVERLWRWSGEGALPIVLDASSCTNAIAEPGEGVLDEVNAARHAQLEILDSVAWAHDRLLPWLEVGQRIPSVAVHPTCATRRMGHAHRLEALAAALAEDVYVPPSAFCCGFAGDRGFSHPELTATATAPEAAELSGRHFDAHLSANRTCEIGLKRATGQPYESVLILLERLTRPA
jgi:D-lactate dehydrogenase